MVVAAIKSFWGKARPIGDAEPHWHPLVWHMLDVGACAQAILEVRPGARRFVTRSLDLEEAQAIRLAVLVATLHDLGKFAAPFQQKAIGPEWPFQKPRDIQLGNSEHDRDGLALWRRVLSAQLANRIWPGAKETIDQLIGACAGHHGRAVDTTNLYPDETFQPEGMAAAQQCAAALVDLLLPVPIHASQPNEGELAAATFWFAGFVTIADWVGSTQTYFPYSAPDIPIEDYWCSARDKARIAVGALGLVPAQPSELKSFVTLIGKQAPTPLQALTERIELPGGPVLVVIEDVTGAGKTEAAQVLVHRLMATGRASGAYWAMPTHATANAMYARQRNAIAALFANGARPQLALAHAGARLHKVFQETILRQAGRPEDAFGDAEPDETATAACAAFLADDARAALIADVGAGTIDQAILGVLPARFQAVRLFGLSEKVLIVDEAHAYDAYVGEELKGLLKFHAALGGSAIVLSATLPRDVKGKAGREQIVRAWLEGCGVGMREWRGKKVVQCDDYPLITIVSRDDKPIEIHVEAAAWSRRKVPVRFVQQPDIVIDALVSAASEGAAVAWVRNTVDDALAADAAIQKRGFAPIVFHARFGQEDRQKIEAAVMARVGPDADSAARRGVIVVATQVIEQSLDLDFDLMASDLAPVDLLIQRAGRLRRHTYRDAERPPVPFELIVKAPAFDCDPKAEWLSEEMHKTEFIYRDPAILWRTMRALRRCGAIETPGGLRGLIEEVYGEKAEVPSGLNPKSSKAEGAAKAEGGQAKQSLLSLTAGYSAKQAAWVAEERVQVRTRLSDAQTTLRLAVVGTDDSLTPWAEDAGPPWKRWALSEVKVPMYRAPLGARPLSCFAARTMVDCGPNRGVPRMRGDEPSGSTANYAHLACSPHARG
jgi:CRISPR-associated endonuclease/helicase Cas3